MLRIILLVIGAWVLYKLIFDLIIPVYRGTKVVRSKIREMQENMQNNVNQQTGQGNFSNDSQAHRPGSDGHKGDYIEFEEVKEK